MLTVADEGSGLSGGQVTSTRQMTVTTFQGLHRAEGAHPSAPSASSYNGRQGIHEEED